MSVSLLIIPHSPLKTLQISWRCRLFNYIKFTSVNKVDNSFCALIISFTYVASFFNNVDEDVILKVKIESLLGYVCNFNDIDSMTNKAISILNDKKNLVLFKENAFNKARNYDINKIVPLYEKTYSSQVI